MNPKKIYFLISVFVILNSCVTQFVPETTEDKKILVVEGLLTDLPVADTIFLTESNPLGIKNIPKPLRGCLVTITDDLGNSFDLTETPSGSYITDPSEFQGITGRSYTLHITNNEDNFHYESSPMELKYVPPIDTLYYEKNTIRELNGAIAEEGCQIYFNTHDTTNQCKYFRWTYTETWEVMLPYTVANKFCWTTEKSELINIKNTSILGEDRIERYMINNISNITDRLRVRYSILLNQYSINEDEYEYWDKIRSNSDQVGGLYDIIPSSIPSNVYCLEDPNIKVLGYFSVSGCKTKRLFIEDNFAGIYTPYTNTFCYQDSVFGDEPIPGLGTFVWVIVDHPLPPPGYKITTREIGCYDCTTRGTNKEPDFWNAGK